MSNKVAACLVFRNAARYLREWLLFHTAAGVEYFYLYDNDSADTFLPAISPWLAAGRAELIRWSGYYQQGPVYNDCLLRAKGRWEWLAFIDDDEFLFDTYGESLPKVLSVYKDAAGLTVSWYLYGTSGRIYLEPDYVINRFTRRRLEIDQHHKCIVRPEYVTGSRCVGHMFDSVPGKAIVDQNGNVVNAPITATPAIGRLRINHYITRSVWEMIERRTSRAIDTGDQLKRPLLAWLGDERHWNDKDDPAAQVLGPKMEQLAREFGG